MNTTLDSTLARARKYVAEWNNGEVTNGGLCYDLMLLLTEDAIDAVISALPADVRAMLLEYLRERIGDESTPLSHHELVMYGTITPGREAEFRAYMAEQSAIFNRDIVPVVRAWLTRHPEAR